MGFFKKVAEDIFPPDEPIEDVEEEVETKKGNTSSKTSSAPVNSLSNKIVCVEPRAYSESQQIADHLKKGNTVVINLRRVTSDQAKRIIDFVSGAVYALKGHIEKIGSGIFLCAPSNVNIQGKITSDKESKEVYNNDDIEADLM